MKGNNIDEMEVSEIWNRKTQKSMKQMLSSLRISLKNSPALIRKKEKLQINNIMIERWYH